MKPRIVRANESQTKIAPDDMFVGQVLQDQVFVPEDPSRMRVTRVTFTPGGRTNWHAHAVGQILYVLSGVGRYQMEGGPVEEIRPGEVTVAMRVTDNHLRPGGTVSGPSMFALADLAAYLLVLSHVGEVALAVTTNLTINFLSKPPQADLYAEGRLLKLGKRLAICEIHIHSRENDLLVAQATATYSIPPR